jgi:hypothetical protein
MERNGKEGEGSTSTGVGGTELSIRPPTLDESTYLTWPNLAATCWVSNLAPSLVFAAAWSQSHAT